MMDKELRAHQRRIRRKLGTPAKAIAYALTIDDHFDMRQFLQDWNDGTVAVDDTYEDYWQWLKTA